MQHPFAKPAAASADWGDAAVLQQKLAEACAEIGDMAEDTGTAKHVLEFSGDLRRRALSRAMAAALAGGASAAKAEAEARASESYSRELDVLAKQHVAAERQVMLYDAAKLRWESARSLLSMMRESIKQL